MNNDTPEMHLSSNLEAMDPLEMEELDDWIYHCPRTAESFTTAMQYLRRSHIDIDRLGEIFECDNKRIASYFNGDLTDNAVAHNLLEVLRENIHDLQTHAHIKMEAMLYAIDKKRAAGFLKAVVIRFEHDQENFSQPEYLLIRNYFASVCGDHFDDLCEKLNNGRDDEDDGGENDDEKEDADIIAEPLFATEKWLTDDQRYEMILRFQKILKDPEREIFAP